MDTKQTRGNKIYLCKRLLVLFVLEGVDERVDDRRCPSQHGCQDVEEGEGNIIINHIHQHQGQEANLDCFAISYT